MFPGMLGTVLGGVLGGVGQSGNAIAQQRELELRAQLERERLAQQESQFQQTQQAQEAQRFVPRSLVAGGLPASLGEDVQQIPVSALQFLLGQAQNEQEQATQARIGAVIQRAQGTPAAPMPPEAAMYSPQTEIPAQAPLPTSDLMRALVAMGPEGIKAAQAFQKEDVQKPLAVPGGSNIYDPATKQYILGPPAEIKPKATSMRFPTAEGEMLVTVDEQGQPVGQPIRIGSISHPPVPPVPRQENATAQLIAMGMRISALKDQGATPQNSPELRALLEAQNTVKPGGGLTPAQQTEEAARLTHRQLLDDITSLYKPEWVGPGRAAAATVSKYVPFLSGAGMLPGTSGPEAEFDKSLEQFQALINPDFAKRFGIQEFTKMKQIMPNKNQPPAVFESAVRATKNEMDKLQAATESLRTPRQQQQFGQPATVPRADPLGILR